MDVRVDVRGGGPGAATKQWIVLTLSCECYSLKFLDKILQEGPQDSSGLIRVNFDPIQEIVSKVGGGCSL